MSTAIVGGLITAGALASALTLGLLRLGGSETYVTDPVATTTLAAAAVAIVVLGVLRSRSGDAGLGRGAGVARRLAARPALTAAPGNAGGPPL